MAQSSFIRTVNFGGYDKSDVNKLLEYLYTQVYDLRNELRENKQLLDSYKKGTDDEASNEAILAAERSKLTMTQVQNETLTNNVKELKAEVKEKEDAIEELNKTVEDLKAKLEESEKKVQSLSAGSDPAALSRVFIEAQKSADMLVSDARKQANDIKSDASKLVENMIMEANNTASRIVYDAEKAAAELEAESQNNAEELKAASGNMRVVMLQDIEIISEEVSRMRELFDLFEKAGIQKIEESEKILKQAENKLTNGGVPIFSMPKKVEPQMPKAPVYHKPDYTYKTDGSADEKTGLELDELARQAQSLSGGAAPAKKGGGIDLADIAKQAESLTGSGNKSEDDGDDLAALAKQAEALAGGKKSDKDKGDKGDKGDKADKGADSGVLDLDAIAKQAEALGKK